MTDDALGGGFCDDKVGRVSEKYGLRDVDDELERRYTRQTDAASLRDLASYFNRRVLGVALDRAGQSTLDGEVENLHRVLTDESVSSGMWTQARNRLRRDGVDVDAVLGDFVSYQTINRHLTGCLDVERPTAESTLTLESARDRLFALQNRTSAVTANTIEQLTTAGDLTVGDVDVFVDITVDCADCGAHLSVEGLFDGSGCDCDEP